jgi:hypothetical protein
MSFTGNHLNTEGTHCGSFVISFSLISVSFINYRKELLH